MLAALAPYLEPSPVNDREAPVRTPLSRKALRLTSIISLREYLLVAQDKRYVEIHRRASSAWTHAVVERGLFRIDCLVSTCRSMRCMKYGWG